MRNGINFIYFLILAVFINMASFKTEVKDVCTSDGIVSTSYKTIVEHNVVSNVVDTIIVTIKNKNHIKEFKKSKGLNPKITHKPTKRYLNCLYETDTNQSKGLYSLPGILPYNGNFRISSKYGMRTHPKTKRWKMHTGIDIAMPKGTPLIATGNGRVIKIKWNSGGYGWYVDVSHDRENKVVVRYAHLKKIKVRVGDYVSKGDVIALSGNTGLSTGPHLHAELRLNGIHVNPMDFAPFNAINETKLVESLVEVDTCSNKDKRTVL